MMKSIGCIIENIRKIQFKSGFWKLTKLIFYEMLFSTMETAQCPKYDNCLHRVMPDGRYVCLNGWIPSEQLREIIPFMKEMDKLSELFNVTCGEQKCVDVVEYDIHVDGSIIRVGVFQGRKIVDTVDQKTGFSHCVSGISSLVEFIETSYPGSFKEQPKVACHFVETDNVDVEGSLE